MREALKVFFYLNHLFAQMVFFSLFALLGLSYTGSGQSLGYTLFLICSGAITYLISLDIVLRRKFVSKTTLILVVLALIILIYGIFFFNNEFVKSQLTLLIVLVVPSIFGGYFMSSISNKAIFEKILTTFSFLVVLGVLRTLPTLLNVSVIELLDVYGGGQYQALSYFCAFSSLVLFSRVLNLTQSGLVVRLFYTVSIIVLVIGVVLSGGRGGLVLVFVGGVALLLHHGGIALMGKSLLFLGVLTSLFLMFFTSSEMFSDRIDESFSRLFSFISSDGIDMEGSSNRDEFYLNAVKIIKQHLIIGLGFFGTVSYYGSYYPHNLFLEILLQGGILYLVFAVLVLVVFFYRLKRILKRDKAESMVLIIALYAFVMLMFSSSYIQEPTLWFALSYVFSFSLKRKEVFRENPSINIRIS